MSEQQQSLQELRDEAEREVWRLIATAARLATDHLERATGHHPVHIAHLAQLLTAATGDAATDAPPE